MKFVCNKCCDDYNQDPCYLEVPDDPPKTKKDIMAGLTTCPFEGCDYRKGRWIKNGENYKAEWKALMKKHPSTKGGDR